MQAFHIYVVTPSKYQQTWVTFPGCQYSMHTVTCSGAYRGVCMTALGQDKWKLVPGVSWIPSGVLPTFVIIICVPFTIINSISTFSEF